MNITGGKYNGQKVQAPDEKIVRPTLSKVRMSIFNTLFSELGDFNGKVFLDMFGGSGIMGLEALSRGFKEVIVFEQNRKVADIIKLNYKKLGLTPNLFIGDSLKLIKNIDTKSDVVYIDPPYMSGVYEQVLKSLPKCEIVVLEHNTDIDLSGYDMIKQKKYGDKYITYLRLGTNEKNNG